MRRAVYISVVVFVAFVLLVGLAWLGGVSRVDTRGDQALEERGMSDERGSDASEPPAGPPTGPDEMPVAPRRITVAEVARHDTRADCWIIVRDGVYDVSTYIDAHPAPPETIVDTCGTDATVAFETKNRGRDHSPAAWRLLERYRVGDLAR